MAEKIYVGSVELRLTWPAGGHHDDHDEQEEGEDGEAHGEVAAAVIEAELLGVAEQEALLLLPGGQLELRVGHLVLAPAQPLVHHLPHGQIATLKLFLVFYGNIFTLS